jgi:hypothetical protein
MTTVTEMKYRARVTRQHIGPQDVAGVRPEYILVCEGVKYFTSELAARYRLDVWNLGGRWEYEALEFRAVTERSLPVGTPVECSGGCLYFIGD